MPTSPPSSRRSAGSAAAVAELHATTRSFAPSASRICASSSANDSSSSRERGPYGKRAVSPKYTKSSCGSDTRHSWSTVRPPTPESKTAIGSSGCAAATAPMLPWAPGALGRRSELHLAHRLLDLRQDHVAERLALVRLEPVHRRHHACHHERDEQDQRDVLD